MLLYVYAILLLYFTFMHLAQAFIQSYLEEQRGTISE